MSENEKKNRILKTLSVSALLLLTAFFLMMLSNRRGGYPLADGNLVEKLEAEASKAEEDILLGQVIAEARGWNPVFGDWYGKMASDFEFKDINEVNHRLSDYIGKDVLLVFWATWCSPCRGEIPHLMALRNSIGQDKLAIIAISNEDRSTVKDFAIKNKLNYMVSSLNTQNLNQPYSLVNSIPCGFFIDPEGRIKLATVGAVNITQMKAILRAKP